MLKCHLFSTKMFEIFNTWKRCIYNATLMLFKVMWNSYNLVCAHLRIDKTFKTTEIIKSNIEILRKNFCDGYRIEDMKTKRWNQVWNSNFNFLSCIYFLRVEISLNYQINHLLRSKHKKAR